MIRFMLAVTTGVAVGAGSAYAVGVMNREIVPASYVEQAQAPVARVVIGLDLSASNPLVDDPVFAAKVADRVAGRIRSLGFRSEVHVRTLGNFDASANGFYYDAVLSIRDRPDDVAAKVRKLIADTPLLVSKGLWHAENRTNILAFLDNVSQSVGCKAMPTTVILATDGLEDSEYARLKNPSDHLPMPDGRPFAGCAELQMLGIGQGTRSPIETQRLRGEWSHWAKAAGFQQFQGLNDW